MMEGLNLDYLFKTEKIILNEIRKIYYFSPDEISKIIFLKLGKITCKENIKKISETFNNLIYFALSGKYHLYIEFEIYTEFDQFSLSLACIYMSLKSLNDDILIHDFNSLLYHLNYDKVK